MQFTDTTPGEILKIMRDLKASSYPDDICPGWLMKANAKTLALDICKVINLSLQLGIVPGKMKHAIVTPLLKKVGLDINDPLNFRPISAIPFLAKILEQVVFRQLQNHFEGGNLFHDTQSWFRPGIGIEISVLAMRERLLTIRDAGGSAALILLDLSAAFDTVDYDILLDRLKNLFGLNGVVLSWIRSFLHERTQCVKMGTHRSTPRPLTCGVPQGSALSPLLFNCYVCPLADIIQNNNLECQLYADDTQILVDSARGPQQPVQLAKCLVEIQDWMAGNRLGLNAAKTEVLLIGPTSPLLLAAWPLSFGPTPIPAKQVKNLGVIIDDTLSFVPHFRNILRNANYHLRLLRKVKHLFT